ncbi:hypothetical protein KI387_032707, partial [Taxus chinensis]
MALGGNNHHVSNIDSFPIIHHSLYWELYDLLHDLELCAIQDAPFDHLDSIFASTQRICYTTEDFWNAYDEVQIIQEDLTQFEYNYATSLDIPKYYCTASEFDTNSYISIPDTDTTLTNLYNTQEEVSNFIAEDFIYEPESYFTEEEDLVGY